MQQLKLALGKEKEINSEKSKNINKSKSQSMWMIEDDSDQIEKKNQNKSLNNSTNFLESKLTDLFKKDKKITQTTFDRIVQEFQQEIGEGKTQISYLLVIQDKLTDLAQDFTGQKKKFFQQFISMVEQRIVQIRKKQKKNQLLQFDKIVKNNFKKKQTNHVSQQNCTNNFLGVASIRKRQKSASRSKSKSKNKNGSKQKSCDKPLNKLLLKERHIKKQKWHDSNQDNLNQTHNQQTQESVSYSAIMSASCAVKQRNRPRRNTKKKDEMQVIQINKEQDGGQQDKQKAFVFYRPKKGK